MATLCWTFIYAYWILVSMDPFQIWSKTSLVFLFFCVRTSLCQPIDFIDRKEEAACCFCSWCSVNVCLNMAWGWMIENNLSHRNKFVRCFSHCSPFPTLTYRKLHLTWAAFCITTLFPPWRVCKGALFAEIQSAKQTNPLDEVNYTSCTLRGNLEACSCEVYLYPSNSRALWFKSWMITGISEPYNSC